MQSSADTLTVFVPHSIHLLRGLNLIASVSVYCESAAKLHSASLQILNSC
ncbi:hypothetical protein LguiB_029066 [Lonicera macranthoides]